MRTRYRPLTAACGICTENVGDQWHWMKPVVVSGGHAGCGPAVAVPLASFRAPAPPYQPRRYSVQWTPIGPPAVEGMFAITWMVSPALAETRSAYASTWTGRFSDAAPDGA